MNYSDVASYEEFHFDKSFGYFISSSSPAELSLQQLFRVRDISSKQLFLGICKLFS